MIPVQKNMRAQAGFTLVEPSTFKDMYSVLPGDITNPNTRLPNCLVAPCSTPGDGNGTILPAPGVAVAVGNEAADYFVHLSAADLITGINPLIGLVWGGQVPTGKVGGGIDVGSSAGNVALAAGAEAAASTMGGVWLYLHMTPGTPAAAAESPFTANEAQRIDTKVDDGVATTGSVSAFGTAGTCWVAATGVYAEATQGKICGLYIRIQG